jgi:hypothetical protein
LTRPFRELQDVARLKASTGRSYQPPDLSSSGTDRRLVSIDRLQPPKQRTKLLTPSVASAGIQFLVCRAGLIREGGPVDRPSHPSWPHMITFIAVHGDCGPVTLHVRRAPWSVFQDGTVPLAYTGGAQRGYRSPALSRSRARGPQRELRAPSPFPAQSPGHPPMPCSRLGSACCPAALLDA